MPDPKKSVPIFSRASVLSLVLVQDHTTSPSVLRMQSREGGVVPGCEVAEGVLVDGGFR